MKRIYLQAMPVVCAMVSAPFAASAATYYNGGTYNPSQYQYVGATAAQAGQQYVQQAAQQYVQQPVQKYAAATQQYATTSTASMRYQVPAAQTAGYTTTNQYYTPVVQTTQNVPYNVKPAVAAGGQFADQMGFHVSAGITHQSAGYEVNLKSVGSQLNWNDISWNIFDINAGYGFDVGGMGLLVSAGFQYGMQASPGKMIDDDITRGGNPVATDLTDAVTGDPTGTTTYASPAVSIGKSSGGNLMGYNIQLGLTDKFKIGNLKLTPMLGWRSLSYKLTTRQNNGISLDYLESNNCIVLNTGEMQCSPQLVYTDNAGNLVTTSDGGAIIVPYNDGYGPYDFTGTSPYGNVDNTYFYSQPGTSHSYNVAWAGPYLALGMDYNINAYNDVNATVELGLPGYSETGDQPYRPDWAHPKSVADNAGFGSAYHIGLGANWLTAMTDNIALSLGFTYDYYTASNATSTTYLNQDWFMNSPYNPASVYNYMQAYPGLTQQEIMDSIGITQLLQECPNWVCKTKNDVSSVYHSLGIRVGVSAKF
ncbi:MAG: hypothetical protein FWC51_04505 [Proteobacteria bacterium]|nr:hypothetical protein [Pseudomonadota bacterium]